MKKEFLIPHSASRAPHAIFSVGIDLGGTWIRLEAVDADRRRVRFFKSPAPTWKDLPALLKKKFHAWKARPRHLVLGSRGVWTPHERNRLKHALHPLARKVRVLSDVEAAWYAAFGGPPSTGIIVISGTGSIAYGRDRDGCRQRAGGWGPLLGDEGSAFWIGKTWLHRTHKPEFVPRASVRRTAALAPKVLRLAQQGNRQAKSVIREAQLHLAELVHCLAKTMHFSKKIPLSWAGSLMDNPKFRAGFLAALRRTDRSFEAAPPEMTPERALARLF